MFNLWLVDWNSTQQRLVSTQFVIATQLKYRVWTAGGVKNKNVSEVLRKYDVCVCVCVKQGYYFWKYPTKVQHH